MKVFIGLAFQLILFSNSYATDLQLLRGGVTVTVTSGAAVQVRHQGSTGSVRAEFQESIDPNWFTTTRGTYANTDKIVGIKDAAHTGTFTCLNILADNCTATDQVALAFPSERAVVFVETLDTSSLGAEYRLARVRIATESESRTIHKASLIMPHYLLLSLKIPESDILACSLDESIGKEFYVIGDVLKWRNAGDTAFTEVALAPASHAGSVLEANRSALGTHLEAKIFEATDLHKELDALKALCVLTREEAASKWFQHPRMYFLKR